MSKLCIINTIKTKIKGNATSYIERENEIFIPVSKKFSLNQTRAIAQDKVTKINKEYLSEKFGKVVSLNTSASNGTGIKIHPSQLLIDAYEVKEGNKSIEELNPRNLDYFNGDEALLEQEQKEDSDLKPFIEESKNIGEQIKDIDQQFQEEKIIKPGVSELFEFKRSFADYSDFGKTLSEQEIINLKKEGTKVTTKQFLESIIPVNDFEKKLKSFLLSIDLNKLNGFDFVINDKYQGNIIGLNERNLFEKPTVIFNSKSTTKPSRYKLHEFLHSLLDTVINEEQEFRTELITLFDYVKTLPEFKNEYGVIGWWEFYTEGMTNPDFQAKLKNVTLSGYKGGKKSNVYEEFVKIINNILEKLGFVNKDYSALDEIINATTKVIEKRYGYSVKSGVSELFEENPELASIGTQKQYSQYLEQNPNGSVEQFKSWVNNRNDLYYQVKNIFNAVKELEDKLKSLNKTANSIGSEKNIDDILKKAGLESDFRKEFLQLLKDNPSLKSLKLSEVISSYLKEFVKESDRQYYTAIEEPLSEELENVLIDYFDKFHIRRKQLDNLKEKFGVDSIGIFDVLAKTIYYSKNRNLLTLPEEYGHVFVELLGSISNKKADNPLFKYLFNNIESWDGYQRVYRDYKDKYTTAEGNIDIYKIKKEAIGQAIGIALVRNYKVQKGDKTFWAKIQETIDYILNLIKGIDYVSLNTTVDNIAKDILSKNYSKLDRLKKDTSNYNLLSYSETIKNQNKKDGGKALKFMQWFSKKEMIITGSLAYRLQGNTYRPEIDALHDIDNIVPSNVHKLNLNKSNFLNEEQLEKDKIYRNLITEGNYKEAKQYKIQGNLKLGLNDVLDQVEVLKDFKKEFPDTDFLYSFYNQKANAYYITINAIWSENQELRDRFKHYTGSFNDRLKNFTEDELSQIYLFDFFLRPETSEHYKKIEDKEFGLSLAHFNYSFYEKLNMMGRAKDAYDYQMWNYFDENNILAPDFNDRLVYFQINQSQQKQNQIQEVFNKNPELSKIGTVEQYSQYLDTIKSNVILPTDRIVFGHPTIGKSFLKNQGEDKFISLDDDYATEINNKVKEIADKYNVTTYQVKDGGTQSWNNEYNQMMQEMFNVAKQRAISENKTLFTSNTNLLKNNVESFDKVINLTDKEFQRRIQERGAKYDTKEWKSQINEAISKLPANKVINTDKYLSDLFLGSKQDIEGFKEFVSKKINNIKTDESINERLMKYEESIKIPNNVKSKVLEKIEKETEKVKEKLLSLGLKQDNNKFELITNSYATFKMKLKELENVNAIISTNKTSDFYQIIARLKNVDSTMELKKQGELPFTPIEVKQVIQEQQFLNDVADNVFEGLSEEEKQILKKKIENGDYDLNCRI